MVFAIASIVLRKRYCNSSVLVQYITRITSSYSVEVIVSTPETGLRPRRDSIRYCLSRDPAEKIATPFTSSDWFTSANASAPAPGGELYAEQDLLQFPVLPARLANSDHMRRFVATAFAGHQCKFSAKPAKSAGFFFSQIELTGSNLVRACSPDQTQRFGLRPAKLPHRRIALGPHRSGDDGLNLPWSRVRGVPARSRLRRGSVPCAWPCTARCRPSAEALQAS